jgi:hypothetical protein
LPEYDSDSFYIPYDLFKHVRADDEHWWRKYVFKASQKIFTVHQAEEMSDVITKAQTYLCRANRIYFLGFGYDKINMGRLFIENDKNLLTEGGLGTRCWGTAMGISPHQKLYLGNFGLSHMKGDYVDEQRGHLHKPLNFPNSTIYDFLYYNPFSILE